MYCSKCETESGSTLFCHVCDNYLPDPNTGAKAGLVRRFVAVLLDDALAIGLVLFAVAWISRPHDNGWHSTIALIALVLYAIAFLGCLSSGLTPGKALLSIRVVDKRTGSPAGFGQMFVREIIGKFVSGFFLGLGFFWAIWDRDAQAWHDKLANTVVVRTEAGITQNQPSGISHEEIVKATNKLLKNTETRFRNWGTDRGLEMTPTASIGLVLGQTPLDKAAVVDALDRAQLAAKGTGKNKVVEITL
jgi:uncharacterized RDD family membrane protein YckC